MVPDFDGKTIVITGGTGSFGRTLTDVVLRETRASRVIVFSRDELKQSELEATHRGDDRLRLLLGDVRDRERLHRVLDGVDVVVHAAALKRIPLAETDPFEFVKTNVLGAQNVIDAAIDRGVGRVVALSTDKASSPTNLYGATKLVSDKLFTAANTHAGRASTRFALVRYGNVLGSRGSVIPLLRGLGPGDVFPLTDERMTRFWITIGQGARFVLRALDEMTGGEVFVPKIPSMKLAEMVRALAPEAKIEITGVRPGEKLHEEMISVHESHRVLDRGDHYVIRPEIRWPGQPALEGAPVPQGFRYSSETNEDWLNADRLVALLDD